MTRPFPLERLHQRLGRPAWFWPAVFALLFILFALGSAEGAAP
jgi:hypothetical protein